MIKRKTRQTDYCVLGQCEPVTKQWSPCPIRGSPEQLCGPLSPNSGRWPHSQENLLYISYCWDDSINTHPEWHAAFWDAREDWDNLGTPTDFYYDSYSQNVLGVVNDRYEDPGYTQWWIQGDIIIKVEAYGNQYWDNYYSYTVNQRRGTAAHEIGHVQGVGHIPRGDTDEYNPHEAMMWSLIYLHETEWLYSPRAYNSALINQVYP